MKPHIFILFSCIIPTAAVAQQLSFKEQSFTFPASTEQLVIAKVNSDNLNDIITVIDDRLRIYFQREDGFDFLDGFDEIVFETVSYTHLTLPTILRV